MDDSIMCTCVCVRIYSGFGYVSVEKGLITKRFRLRTVQNFGWCGRRGKEFGTHVPE